MQGVDGVSGDPGEDGTRITDCLSISNQFDGISSFLKSIVERCTAKNNGGNGIVVGPSGVVADCLTGVMAAAFPPAKVTWCEIAMPLATTAPGIYLGFNSRVLDSQCVSNGNVGCSCRRLRCGALRSRVLWRSGFYAQDNTTVKDCVALAGCGGDGITLVSGNTSIFNSNTRSNVGYGVSERGRGVVSGNVIRNNRDGGVTAVSYSVIREHHSQQWCCFNLRWDPG